MNEINIDQLDVIYDEYNDYKKTYCKELHDKTVEILQKIKNILKNNQNLKSIKTKIVGSIGNGTVVVDTNKKYDLDITLIKKINEEKIINEGQDILNLIQKQVGELYNSTNKRTITLKTKNKDMTILVDLAIVFVKNNDFYNATYFNKSNKAISEFNPDHGAYNSASKEIKKIKGKKLLATYNDAVKFAKYLKYFHPVNFGEDKNELYIKIKDAFINTQNQLNLQNKKLNKTVKKNNSIIILQNFFSKRKTI